MSCHHQSRKRKAPMGRRLLVVLLSAAYTIVLLRMHRSLDDQHYNYHYHQEQSKSLTSSSFSRAHPYERLQAAQRFWSKQRQEQKTSPTSVIRRRRRSRRQEQDEQQHQKVQQQQQQSPLRNSTTTTSSTAFENNFARPSSSYVIDPNDLWEDDQDPRGRNDTSTTRSSNNMINTRKSMHGLPNWMKDYFRWHKETRQMFLREQGHGDSTNHTNAVRYLILSCPARSRKCGGLADRLMPIPFLVFLAAKTQRLFLIQWGRPAPLEEFLLPPVGGVDWRIVPGILLLPTYTVGPDTSSSSNTASIDFARNQDDLLQMTQNSSLTTVQCRLQSHDHGGLYYDNHARQLALYEQQQQKQQQQQQEQLHQEQQQTVLTSASSRAMNETTINNNNHAANDPTMQQVMRKVWHIFFTPSPAVAQVVTQFMRQHRIVPGHYMASHLRALYGVPTREDYLIKHWTRNAVNCSMEVIKKKKKTTTRTTIPAATNATTNDNLNGNGIHDDIDESVLYFASDSDFAMRVAQRYGASNGIRVVQRQGPSLSSNLSVTATIPTGGPLHLDKTIDWRQRPPSDFYDTFVDLLLMANARCVGYGMGGFGKLAAWLSSNVSCSMQHHRAIGVTSCQFPETTTTTIRPQFIHAMVRPQLNSVFFPPMVPSPVSSTDQREGQPISIVSARLLNTSDAASSISRVDGPVLDPPFPNLLKTPSLGSYLWEGSTTLPRWMKDYFVFHQESRNGLTRENWRHSNSRYLIVECVESATHCGGAADRLRPIPFYVRLAAETRRVLFIHWDKPKPLEEFLLPPVGGMDWRLPLWLHDELGNQTTFRAINKLIPAAQDRKRVIVQARIQAHDHGSKYYNTQGVAGGDGPDSFRQHYHDCWYILFTPVPVIAKLITKELEQLDLVPGEFAFAHLRALYGIEQQKDGRDFESYIRPWTQNSLNCLSNLRPGGPFLFSSDSDLARQVAVEYGRARNTTVVARLDAPKPLHLDLVPDWAVRNASDFYDIFVDLYLMSQGRCMSYNMGGYGKWAQLISGRNFTCNVRHWTKGVNKASANKEGCNWTEPSSALVFQHTTSGTPPARFEKPLFLPSMKEDPLEPYVAVEP